MSGGDTVRPQVTLVKAEEPVAKSQDKALLIRHTVAQERWALLTIARRVASLPPGEWQDNLLVMLLSIEEHLHALRAQLAPEHSGAEAG
jgi:hypothetical protein